MSNTKRSRNADKRIHTGYKRWDGRPMDIVEIAKMTHVDVNTIKRTLKSAMQKMRETAPPHIAEYLDD